MAQEVADRANLEVEVFDEAALVELGAVGPAGHQRGQRGARDHGEDQLPAAGEPTAHLGLVGKGIMYDSGGISLKPRDASHSQMKNDMSGAGAVLAAMTALRAGLRDRRHRLSDVHRQHASGLGDAARRRAHHARRHDRRGA